MSLGRGEFPIRYGFLVLRNVSRVNVLFGNQTIISPAEEWTDQLKELTTMTGGNLAITVHGYFRGRDRRVQVACWETWRNVQALIAHIPGSYEGSPTVGQLLLWFITLFTPFQSEITWQMNMVIKEMEFEHAATLKNEYAYQITFEKLSFGILQFVIDTIVSAVAGVLAFDGGNYLGASGNGITTSSMFLDVGNARGSDRLISSSVDPNVINTIVSSVNDTEEQGQESSNNLSYYNVKTVVDEDLDWYEMPFMNAFPQTFSFDFNGHYYETEWRLMSIENEDGGFDYNLRLKLTEDEEILYIGKIIEKMQYNFKNNVAIYIRNFKISVSNDGQILYMLRGMISSLD